MLKILFRPLIAVVLLFSFVLSLVVATVTFRQGNAPLLYLTDYDTRNHDYMVMDVETGDTMRIQRPSDFRGIQYYGEVRAPERENYTSPYDNSVRFALLRDLKTQNIEEVEQLYRVWENDQFELILSGADISIRSDGFSDNGRYVYLFKIGEYYNESAHYLFYRYDIESSELQVVAEDLLSMGLNCQDSWCENVSGNVESEDEQESLLVLHKNSGVLRQLDRAEEIDIRFWWGQNVLMYTSYHGDGNAIINIYNIETDQRRNLAEFEGREITSIYGQAQENSSENNQGGDWLMVVANSPENDSEFDVYIVNNLGGNATIYPLGIQTRYGTWLPHRPLPDGSVLLTSHSPQNNRESSVYIINDVATHPTVDQLDNDYFDVITMQDARLEYDLGDTQLLRVGVDNTEWRYYTVHVPTRTITQLAVFNGEWDVHTMLSEDKRWLAISIEIAGEYSLGVLPVDGSQPLRLWDVGTESYVCLLTWHELGVVPPACGLHFGMG